MLAGQAPQYGDVVSQLARERFGSALVARLATVTPDGRPHIVPITFAVQDDTVWTAVDGKPKRSRSLQRLANIAAHPAVSLLADHYADDWSDLWWVRADGQARQLDAGSPEEAEGLRRLEARYWQYQANPPRGPVVAVTVTGWRSWVASPVASDEGELP